MSSRALRICPTPGCPNLTPGGRCPPCIARAEAARGTARQRGYDEKHRKLFRKRVLERDPLCVCTDRAHGHGGQCLVPSVHADHHPHGRDELVAKGLDPNDSQYGRGLCHRCHSKSTAAVQPGGWNKR